MMERKIATENDSPSSIRSVVSIDRMDAVHNVRYVRRTFPSDTKISFATALLRRHTRFIHEWRNEDFFFRYAMRMK